LAPHSTSRSGRLSFRYQESRLLVLALISFDKIVHRSTIAFHAQRVVDSLLALLGRTSEPHFVLSGLYLHKDAARGCRAGVALAVQVAPVSDGVVGLSHFSTLLCKDGRYDWTPLLHLDRTTTGRECALGAVAA
jgi:hypothetical protein